jgi:hypothetical protein
MLIHIKALHLAPCRVHFGGKPHPYANHRSAPNYHSKDENLAPTAGAANGFVISNVESHESLVAM